MLIACKEQDESDRKKKKLTKHIFSCIVPI